MRNSGRKFFKKYNLEQFTVFLKVYYKIYVLVSTIFFRTLCQREAIRLDL